MVLSETLEELRDAHRDALDWGIWAADQLSGPGARETREAVTRFDTLYNRLYRRLKELEAAG
jgi:hypothetical protein